VIKLYALLTAMIFLHNMWGWLIRGWSVLELSVYRRITYSVNMILVCFLICFYWTILQLSTRNNWGGSISLVLPQYDCTRRWVSLTSFLDNPCEAFLVNCIHESTQGMKASKFSVKSGAHGSTFDLLNSRVLEFQKCDSHEKCHLLDFIPCQ